MANATVYVATTGNDSTGDGSSGNPYATPGKAGSAITGSGNTVYIKAGTYTLTNATSNTANGPLTLPAGASGVPNRLIGYNAAVGDLDDVTDFSNFPVIQGTATGPATCLNLSNTFCWASNLILDGNGQATHGLDFNANYNRAVNCKAMRASSYGFYANAAYIRIARCLATGCGIGIYLGSHSSSASGSVATACTLTGFRADTYPATFDRCIAYSNSGATVDGFMQTGAAGSFYVGCVAYNNGRDGIRFDTAATADVAAVRNCILASNGAYGIRSAVTTWTAGLYDYNAFYSNTSGLRSGVPAGAHDVTLTASPFTNAGGGDFSLNGTAGGGAACRAAGFPGVLPGGLTTGYLDIGTAQHQDTGGGGGTTITGFPLSRIFGGL